MSRVKNAVAATVFFAAGTGGLWAAENHFENIEDERTLDCARNFDGEAQKACIDNVPNAGFSGLDILQLAGVIGIIGSGALVYRSVKEQS